MKVPRSRILREAPSRPPVNRARDWSEVPASEKVEIIQAMGFTPVQDPHQPDCPRGYGGSGFVCNCVPDPTSWMPPQDVMEYRHETWEERLAERRAENGRG